MKLKLNNGEFALIDKEDLEKVSKYNWGIKNSRGKKYVYTRTSRKSPPRKTILLSRFVMNCPRGLVVDHIKGDTLDNRKSQLRICSQHKNMFNQKPQKRIKTSKYKGVYWNKRDNKYHARVKFNKKNYSCGYFDCEKEAAKAYDKKAKELFGEFSCLNFN